jgi:hypothetical protein
MTSTCLLITILTLGSPVVACAQLGRDSTSLATPADVRHAMRDSTRAWLRYRTDGSARGDSARRFAAAAMWDFEGGDRSRGRRLLASALRLGLTDSTFFLDLADVLHFFGCPAESVSLFEYLQRRWPNATWVDSASKSAVASRQRFKPANTTRPCPVPLPSPPPLA